MTNLFDSSGVHHNVVYTCTDENQFGLGQAKEYTKYKLLETSSAILCTHTIQLICSPTRENDSSFYSQAGPESRRTWERTVDHPSYNAVGGALKPSVASIPLFPGFPGLGGPREATPSRGAVLSQRKPRQDCQQSPVHLKLY